MAIKFYTDEHVDPGIAKALRKNGIDVLTAQQAGMLDIDDKQHLQFSTSQGRVIFAQDDDFLDLHWKMQHSGIADASNHRGIDFDLRSHERRRNAKPC